MNRRQIGYLISVMILLAWVSVTLADTVPEEAQRYMARGMAAVEMAKTPKDYERAVREFEQAAKLAPNWPDVYFNLGSVQAKAGNYGEAMRHYKRYLELAPNAPDAAKVREEIYKLEYRAEEKETEFAFLEGDWTCEFVEIKFQYKVHYTVRGNQVEATSTTTNPSTKMTAVYAAEIIEDKLVLSGRSTSHPEYGESIEKYKVLSNTVMHQYSTRLRGVERNTNIKCHKDDKVKIGNIQSATPNSGSAPVPSLLTGAYKGVRNYENGDKYEGEFTNRKFNGRGTYTYANGDKYVGEFVDGKFTGRGTFTCSNGKQFTGNLENKVPLEFTIRCN